MFSQCTTVPVEEAVRNGDFEAGYLPGGTISIPETSHTYTTGGIFDFESDLGYAGEWKDPSDPCEYGMPDLYGIGRVEKTTNPGCGTALGTDVIVYGMYANASLYKDHTTGTSEGFSMFVDFNHAGGFEKVWAQTVDVYGSQRYYFSSWFAQYSVGPQSIPTLRFRVESFDATGSLIETSTVGIAPISPPSMSWQQFNGSYDTPPNAVTAKLFIECQPTGQSSQDDFMIDDISFINSCQNISSQVDYTLDFDKDEVNFCDIGGEYVAQVLKNNGTPLTSTGKLITWYEGTDDPQTEISSWANNPSPTITNPGKYRVCVVDAANGGCTVGSTVVVKEDLNLNVSDYILCNPAELDIDLGLTVPNDAYNLDWTGPSGNVSNSSIYTVSHVGNHLVTATPINGYDGCSASDNFNVTSNLPEPDILGYCEGGGSDITLVHKDGVSYKWAKDADMNDVIGSNNGVPLLYTVPSESTDTIKLWIQNAETNPIGSFGPDIALFTGAGSVNDYTELTINETILLKSVSANVASWGPPANRSVLIEKIGGVSKTYGPFTISGITELPLDAVLTPGDYRIKISGGAVNTKTVYSGSASTYSFSAYGEISGYSNNHGPFGDFVIEESNACEPVPIFLKPVSCCTAPTDNPSIDSASSSLKTCTPYKGEVVSVSGLTDGLEYKWQKSSDGITFNDITGSTGVISGGEITLSDIDSTYFYRYKIALTGNLEKTCVKISDSVQVLINPTPDIDSIARSPYKTSYCVGEEYKLIDSLNDSWTGGTLNYNWKDSVLSSNQEIDGLDHEGTFKYKLVVESDKGCSDSDSVTITVNPLEIADIEKDSFYYHLCDTVPFKPTTNGGSTPFGTFTVKPPEKAEVISSALIMKDSGSVMVYYKTPGVCFAVDSFAVIVREVDSAEFDLSIHNPDKVDNDTIKFCAKDTTFSFKLTDKSTDGGNWSTRNETLSTDIYVTDSDGNFDATGLLAGLYSVKYSVSKYDFCSDSDSIFILILPLDTAEIIQLPPLCSGDDTVQLELNTSKPSSGVWSDTTSSKNEYITAGGEFKLKDLAPNKYPVIFTPNQDCSSPDTIYITISNQITYEFPKGDTSFCLNHSPDIITINDSFVKPSGGKFWTTSGDGVSTDSLSVLISSYSVAQTDSLYYGQSGQCGDTVGIELTLLSVDFAEIDSLPSILSLIHI